MARFNFTNITLTSTADITDVMDNFNEIENNAAILSDLSHVYSITLTSSNWTLVDNNYEYTISNANIEVEPQIVDIVFDNLTIIQAPINPKPNSQAADSIKLITSIKPSVDLTAKLILTRGIS